MHYVFISRLAYIIILFRKLSYLSFRLTSIVSRYEGIQIRILSACRRAVTDGSLAVQMFITV